MGKRSGFISTVSRGLLSSIKGWITAILVNSPSNLDLQSATEVLVIKYDFPRSPQLVSSGFNVKAIYTRFKILAPVLIRVLSFHE